jgi:hypothetical protein
VYLISVCGDTGSACTGNLTVRGICLSGDRPAGYQP